MTNPLYDPYQILCRVYGEGAHLKQAIAETPIEELNRLRTVKIVYGVLEEDGYLSQCIRTFAPKSPKLPVRVLLKIALYMILFLHKQKYMVTDNAVALAKKLGKGGASGFINAFLRAFDAGRVRFPEGEEGRLDPSALHDSLPDISLPSGVEARVSMGEVPRPDVFASERADWARIAWFGVRVDLPLASGVAD